MLDTATLRITFSVVAFTLLVLFYLLAYRRTRSKYSAWWCLAIALFLAGASLYLLDGTAHQWWANPAANSMLVAGAASVWAGARTLRTTRPKVWQLAAGPAGTAVASALDQPAVNDWAGGPVFLGLMALLMGLASSEMWRTPLAREPIQRPMAVGSGVLAVFYSGRCVAFVVDGADGRTFQTYFGSSVTTLITLTLLVVVSFSMTALSNEQATRALQLRATQDGLTGLLNRACFLDLAEIDLQRMRQAGTTGSLILADLDHFKAVNDTYGHAAGDEAIRSFAEACTRTVRSTDLVGRYGGEEFVLLLPGAAADRAETLTAQISAHLHTLQLPGRFRLPTASYGIAEIGPGTTDLESVIARADAALYEAKSAGRDRAAHAAAEAGGRTAPGTAAHPRPTGRLL